MPIGQLQNTRNMELQANIQNSQNSMAGLGAIGSIFGTVLGMSDDSLKENLNKIGETPDGIGIYEYTWKDSPELGIQIGVMASEVKEKRPDAFGSIFGYAAVDYGKI